MREVPTPAPWSPFRWLSRSDGAGGRRLQIFIFHRVLAAPDPLFPDEPDAARFDSLATFIARNFNVLPLDEAAARLQRGQLPPAAACITFDDGYADNRTVAVPILRRHGLTATFFIATGFIGGGRMWNDTVIDAVRRAPAAGVDWADVGLGGHALPDAAARVQAYQQVLKHLKHRPPAERAELTAELARRSGVPATSDLMMTPAQLRELLAMGMALGGHTVTHPILSRLDDAAARREIGEGRDMLRSWTGQTPAVFAYPNGVPGQDYGARDVQLVRSAGFVAAVSTSPGAASAAGNDPLQLPRFTPWDTSLRRFALRCAWNLRRAVVATV